MVCWRIWILLNPSTLNGNAFSGSIEHVFRGLNTTFLHGPNTTFLYSVLFSVDLSSNQLTGCIPGLTTGLGQLVQSSCNPILVSVVSLNKTQCHKWEQETDHSSLSLSISMGLPFLQISVRFSQLKQELGDAKGIWTWSGNQGNLIFEENLSIISNQSILWMNDNLF